MGDLRALLRAIAARRPVEALALLAAAPELARARLAETLFLDEIPHHAYAGDGALHVAGAAHAAEVARALLAAGAEVGARNRRGATPLHYAADADPNRVGHDPEAQAATAAALLAAGADPEARDASGVAPLHRAARTRGVGAVRALLAGGADRDARNAAGSTAADLAGKATGRGGSGTDAARAAAAQILALLRAGR